MDNEDRSTGDPAELDAEELDAEELALWRGLLVWYESFTTDVERELTAATGLSAADFQILARLSEAPDGTIEQHVLRTALCWSASRLSHQLTRMERRGYITRAEVGPGTRMQIGITPSGEQAMRGSLQVHAQAVRRYLLDTLTPVHRRELAVAVEKAQARR